MTKLEKLQAELAEQQARLQKEIEDEKARVEVEVKRLEAEQKAQEALDDAVDYTAIISGFNKTGIAFSHRIYTDKHGVQWLHIMFPMKQPKAKELANRMTLHGWGRSGFLPKGFDDMAGFKYPVKNTPGSNKDAGAIF